MTCTINAIPPSARWVFPKQRESEADLSHEKIEVDCTKQHTATMYVESSILHHYCVVSFSVAPPPGCKTRQEDAKDTFGYALSHHVSSGAGWALPGVDIQPRAVCGIRRRSTGAWPQHGGSRCDTETGNVQHLERKTKLKRGQSKIRGGFVNIF